MLSINITDNGIGLVCGVAYGEKIIIRKTAYRRLEKNTVVNGYIKDLRSLAGQITALLTEENIKEKRNTVLINSGLIVFKEILLPKPKNINSTELLEKMIRNDMGLTNDYNFTYTVIGEEVKDSHHMLRVMASACPQDIVDGYEELFEQIGINLKNIFVADSCLTRLVSHSRAYDMKMPMIALELGKDYINFNVFENKRITLTRYVKVEPREYEDSNDYLNLTVFDNLFRIIHLFAQKSEPIKEILYHGHVEDSVSLENNISQFNIPVSKFNKPPEVSIAADEKFYENVVLAGSLCDINKKTENLNLIHSFKYRNKKVVKSFTLSAFLVFIASIALVVSSVFFFYEYERQTEAIIYVKQLEYTLLKTEEVAAEKQDLITNIEKLHNHIESAWLAKQLFDFQPKMIPDIMAKLRSEMFVGMIITGLVSVDGYNVSVSFLSTDESHPTKYTKALESAGYFENIVFSGYDKTEDNQFMFSLKMELKGGNKFEIG